MFSRVREFNLNSRGPCSSVVDNLTWVQSGMSISEPVAMRRHLKYILWFAQENVEFRAEELTSIAKTLNIRMIPEANNYSPRDVGSRCRRVITENDIDTHLF